MLPKMSISQVYLKLMPDADVAIVEMQDINMGLKVSEMGNYYQ